MINKFFNEYGQQKAAWIHEQDVTDHDSKDLKVLAKNDDILRNRIVRTFLKRHPKTLELTTYNFDPAEFKKYLLIYNAILPGIITQNNNGDFVLMFETDNKVDAFLEAFSSGIEIKGTQVYFKKVGYHDLGNAMRSVKALLNKQKSEKKQLKKQFISRIFPRNIDDHVNLGGLLQLKHPCSIDINEIFHSDWHQNSLKRFEFVPFITENANENENEENKEMQSYYKHLETMNRSIWTWYHGAIPHKSYMDKMHSFLQIKLMSMIHSTLHLPNIESTHINKMITIFGSLSYGLFILHFSDIDIGVNLNINQRRIGNNKNNKNKREQMNKKVKFLQLLSHKIKNKTKGSVIKQKRKTNATNTNKQTEKNNKYEKKAKKIQKIEKRFAREKYHGVDRDIIINDERFDARVPILKLYAPNVKCFIDISLNNNDSNLVSKLIMLYVKYDERVRPLLCAIKYWIHRRNICKAFKGFLNSFGWVLLGIKFLQCMDNNPILPLMKLDMKTGAVLMNKSNLNDETDAVSNRDTVSELLSSFFEFYSNFDFNKYQISITTNEKYQLKQGSDEFQNNNKKGKCIWVIQHPMIENINVAGSVRKWTAHLMKGQLKRASDVILKDDWKVLTEELNDSNNHNIALNADPDFKYSVLLVRNLRYDVSEKQLIEFVSRVAKPISVVMSSFKSGRHVGKAYVAFETPQIAHIVMAELNNNLLLGRSVVMLFAPLESIENDDMDVDDDGKDGKVDDGDVLNAVRFSRKIKMIGGDKNNDKRNKKKVKKKRRNKNKENNQTYSALLAQNGEDQGPLFHGGLLL